MTRGPASGHRRSSAARVLQWARRPGPVGGVTSAVEAVTEELVAGGRQVRFVNTASPVQALRAVPLLWRRRSLHLFHITRVWRGLVLAPIFGLLPGRTVLVLHSGSVAGQLAGLGRLKAALVVAGLHCYDEIWAVNDSIRTALPPSLRPRARVVVPTPRPPATAVTTRREAHLVTVATNSGKPYYRPELALDAVALVRAEWPDARLLILAYDEQSPALDALRHRVEEHSWAQLVMNLSAERVAEELSRSAVFVRPTRWDGDSVIVREALALGTRVVASDVCPRPAGVELAAPTAAAFAEAILHGAAVSDGAGVGGESLAQAAERVAHALEQPHSP